MRYFLHASLLCFFFLLLQVQAIAQYKTVYLPDTTGLKSVTQFRAEDILETNRPGAPLTITGTMVALDSTGQYPQPWFQMHASAEGVPQGFHWYTDSTSFIFSGAAGLASAWDGDSTFYVAGSSNNYQCLFSTQDDGDLNWSRAIHHHDFYDIRYESNSSIIALGQDESFLGVHDFSLVRLDSTGTLSAGLMLGTEGFDLPEKVIPTPSGYLVCGSAFIDSDFQVLVAEVDTDFNLLWGYTYITRSGNHLGREALRMPDGSGYMIGGYISGSVTDSLFLMKISNAGVPVFFQTYHQGSASKFELNGMDVDPTTGNLFLAGTIGDVSADQPFVLKTDNNGTPLWFRNYGDGPAFSSEFFSDITVLSDHENFAACGSYYDLAASAHYKIMMVTASLDSGATPCDSAGNVVTGSMTVVRDSALLTQPFLIQYDLPFGHHTSTMNVAAACSVMVGTPSALTGDGISLTATNPVTDQTVHLRWALPLAETSASLSVWSLTGELLSRISLNGNRGETQVTLQNQAEGLILIRLDSPSGLSCHQKLVVIR